MVRGSIPLFARTNPQACRSMRGVHRKPETGQPSRPLHQFTHRRPRQRPATLRGNTNGLSA